MTKRSNKKKQSVPVHKKLVKERLGSWMIFMGRSYILFLFFRQIQTSMGTGNAIWKFVFTTLPVNGTIGLIAYLIIYILVIVLAVMYIYLEFDEYLNISDKRLDEIERKERRLDR